ncbi:major facilitator superfamily domain-containing protein 12 [Sebastes umbrosus]|uniref:major facilitator superfamily domain-containing protein 12 n=1 Tax=Sebastes umbrosus TaxID=72105 RepID=UPI0018A01F0A|nr:major facilitator superfamily domain-containing protein 12 [Sebastes umbrosus]
MMEQFVPAAAAAGGRSLSVCRRFCFSVGHFLNDLCASMWFTYMLVYLHKVLGLKSSYAGVILLMGQIEDGVFTLLVGYESDRTSCSYGKRKTWHLMGEYLTNQLGIHKDFHSSFSYEESLMLNFTVVEHTEPCKLLFDCFSHILPYRYACTNVANITLYAVAWLLFHFQSDDIVDPSVADNLGPVDIPLFRTLALVMLGIGSVFSLIFHVGTKEDVSASNGETQPITSSSSQPRPVFQWKHWLKEPSYYQMAFLYMFTRQIVNLSQTYISVYLINSLMLPKNFIAIIPLVMCVSGFVCSLVMKPVSKLIGIIDLLTRKYGKDKISSPKLRQQNQQSPHQKALPSAVGIGAFKHFLPNLVEIGLAFQIDFIPLCFAVATIVISDLCLVWQQSGAFVYGSMSLIDKVASGVGIFLIQSIRPGSTEACCLGCVWFYRVVMVTVTGAMAVPAGLLLISAIIWPVRIRKVRVQNLHCTQWYTENSHSCQRCNNCYVRGSCVVEFSLDLLPFSV